MHIFLPNAVFACHFSAIWWIFLQSGSATLVHIALKKPEESPRFILACQIKCNFCQEKSLILISALFDASLHENEFLILSPNFELSNEFYVHLHRSAYSESRTQNAKSCKKSIESLHVKCSFIKRILSAVYILQKLLHSVLRLSCISTAEILKSLSSFSDNLTH